MKKQVKKFISAVLASTMAVTGVAVTNFAVTPVSVLAASNIAVYESVTQNGLGEIQATLVTTFM